MALIDAVKTGDRRTTLEALRDTVAATIDECGSARDMAALAKRLLEICAEIDSLPDDDDTSPLAEARRTEHAR